MPTGRTSSSSGRTSDDVEVRVLVARCHPLAQLRHRAGAREQVTLPEVATDLAKPGVLLGSLDALRHGGHTEAPRQRHDGRHECAIAAAPGQARGEAAVDLERV